MKQQTTKQRLGLDAENWRVGPSAVAETQPEESRLIGEILAGVECAVEWCDRLKTAGDTTPQQLAEFARGTSALTSAALDLGLLLN